MNKAELEQHLNALLQQHHRLEGAIAAVQGLIAAEDKAIEKVADGILKPATTAPILVPRSQRKKASA